MFEQIAQLTTSAGLSGVTMTMRPAPTGGLYVVVSFMLSNTVDHKVWDAQSEAAQAYVGLRNALSVPVVITAAPEEILEKVQQSLAALTAPVTEAAKAHADTDIAALLKAAQAANASAATAAQTKQKPTAPAKASTPAAKEKKVADDAPATAGDSDKDFSSFDSL